MEPEKTCLELALEGERRCKAGDCRKGVYFFESAIQVGTSNLKTLSAIYSQMGNAYFYLQDYEKALEYHKHDLNLAKTIQDRLGEAKAYGNIGNTLKVLGLYDEAIMHCKQHLTLSVQLADKIGEARALYNLGNVFHATAKAVDYVSSDAGCCPHEIEQLLQQAIDCYRQNLQLVTDLGDKAAQGRVFGNLGNTFYLLGDFVQAVDNHEQRLSIAKEFGDKAAQRRAYSNLGNAYIFRGQFTMAAEQYKQSLQLSRQLCDRALEAQACYSLGNTYTLLADYNQAIEYHTQHLKIARELSDCVGESRACWSLANALTALNDCQQALQYARRHRDLSAQIGDTGGLQSAEKSLQDLQKFLGITATPGDIDSNVYETHGGLTHGTQHTRNNISPAAVQVTLESESLFELISQSQSRRIDDQRCSLRYLVSPVASSVTDSSSGTSPSRLSRLSASHLDDSLSADIINTAHVADDEQFIDMLLRSQACRMDDQRSSGHRLAAPTVPDDDFFNLIQRLQSNRLDTQRSAPPTALLAAPRQPLAVSSPTPYSNIKMKKH